MKIPALLVFLWFGSANAVSLFLSKSVYYQNGSHRQQQPLNEKPTDTFAGEVVDQADVEFNKMSGGDDCISKKDAYKALESMMNEGGPMSPEEEQVFREHKAALKSEIKHNFHETDKDGDGCITRKEFKADNEMESPDTPAEMMGDAMQEPPMVPGEPEPGFAEVDKDQNGVLNTTEFTAFMNALETNPSYITDGMFEYLDVDANRQLNKTEFEHPFVKFDQNPKKLEKLIEKYYLQFQEEMQAAEFNMMDTNGDKKISLSEAFDFASNNMPQADINSVELEKIFKASDINQDKFLSFDEYKSAGKSYKGDGPGQFFHMRSSSNTHMPEKSRVRTIRGLTQHFRPLMKNLQKLLLAVRRHGSTQP